MARVYVSSTYTDLKEHREAVRSAIRRLGHEDVAMEHYVAEDKRPVDRCLEDVQSADLYIVVMAWRYGFIPPGHEMSITELEYRAALTAEVPCLAFVLSDEEAWPPKLMERSPKVDEFRDELTQKRIAGLFGSKDDLARQVAEGVQKWERQDRTVEAGVDWDAYRQAVVDRYRHVRLSVIAGAQHDRMARIPLLDVFVPQQLRSGRPHYDLPDEEGGGGPAPAEDSVAVLGRERKQVILGGPGSGKSTLFHASLLAISDVAGDDRWVPPSLQDLPLVLLIELREYVLLRSQDFVAYLIAGIWEKFNVRVGEAQLIDALHNGAVVFFDGLDEIFEPAARARVIEQFRAFTGRFPHARVVVSSRIVGYDESELGLAGFEHYTVLDFGLKEIREFVPSWYEHYTFEGDERDAAGLIRRITDNARLLELAGNPLLLTMMAVIYKHQDLPEKRWQLYERCTAVLLEDWDVKRKKIDSKELLPLDFRLGGEQKAEILQNIARTMVQERSGAGHELNAIAYQPLRRIIGDYLNVQYGKPPGEAQAIAVEILNHLRERTFILAETGDGVFGFVHRTFMEYFAAKHVLAEFTGKKADYAWLTESVFREYWRADHWREPLLLLSAMVAGHGFPIREIVTAVASEPHLSALPFAARCLGEAGTVPAEDQEWTTNLAQKLVEEVAAISPKAESSYRAVYVAEVASALASLAGFVTISETTQRRIQRYRTASAVGDRIVGFQLELAIASRAERRRAALAGLGDKDEAVRRAAVASLDRESGDEEIYQAFVEQLRRERYVRVREPLITAIDRGWPARHDVLDAIAMRAPRETSIMHLQWVAEHLSTVWAGDPTAREVVLGLAKREGLDDYNVQLTVGYALLRGWASTPGFERFLLDRIATTTVRTVRHAAVRACAVVNLGLLCEWFWQDPATYEDLAAMLDGANFDDVAAWISSVMKNHPDRRFRTLANIVYRGSVRSTP